MRELNEFFPFYRRSDFKLASQNANVNMPASLAKGCGGRVTTALDYFHAMATAPPHKPPLDDAASRYLDLGFLPHIVSKAAHHAGTWPWLEVYDVGQQLTSEGRVVLVLPLGTVRVYTDTLIFWR